MGSRSQKTASLAYKKYDMVQTRLSGAAASPGYVPPPPLGPCCGGGLRLGAEGLYSTPLGASPDSAGDTPPGGGAPAAAAAPASVGEYCGEVGLYCGLHRFESEPSKRRLGIW